MDDPVREPQAQSRPWGGLGGQGAGALRWGQKGSSLAASGHPKQQLEGTGQEA